MLTKRSAAHSSSKELPHKTIKMESTPVSSSQDHGDASVPRSLESSFINAVGVPYSQRTNIGTVVTSFTSAKGTRGSFQASQQRPLGNRVVITEREEDFDSLSGRYRFMYTPLEERARNLDKQLLRLQKAMCQRAHLSESSLTPVGVPSQDMVWVCGRIYCDSAQGKLNKTSVSLEGSLKESNGRRVQLNLSEVPQFSLFPGQVVLVEGINPTGKKMTVRRIIDGCAPSLPRTMPTHLLQYHHSEHTQVSCFRLSFLRVR